MAAEARDLGSTTTSYKPSEKLKDFIQKHGRGFREEMQQRAEFVSKTSLQSENTKPAKRNRLDTGSGEDLAKNSEEINKIKDRLFTIARKWMRHSGFLQAAKSANLSLEDTKTNLYLAASSSIKTLNTIHLY